jgi:hypothetical protein
METSRMWLACLLLAVLIGLAAGAQEPFPGAEESPGLRLLLVDATKTFSSTARVGALAGAIRSTGLFDLRVCFSNQQDTYQDPMPEADTIPEGPFNLVLFVPRGLDNGTAGTIWIVTTASPWTHSSEWDAVRLLSGLVDAVFAGSATAVGPTEDLWTALLASLYCAQGWLR